MELDSYKINIVNTLYIGGGTPTSLSDADFDSLLNKASKYLSGDYEFTVEANVENLSESKLLIMKKHGVNRLSIGVESTSFKALKLFNRHHSFEEATKVVKLAKKHGFNNINVDLIYGYEGQTIEELRLDLQKMVELDTPHISIYSLTVNPGTLLFNMKHKEQDQDESRLFYDEIVSFLRKHGYTRYEVSNFAKPGYESKHNQVYWRNEEYYGIGLGASGYINDVRYTNTKNLDEYCNNHYLKSSELVTKEDFYVYFLMLNLRMEEGFNKELFKNLFGFDFYENNKAICDELINQNLMIANENIKLTDEGIAIMDSILLKFFN